MILTPWIAESIIISWRSVRNKHRPPLPSEFLATFVVFGAFSVVGSKSPRIGAALGWGIVIATFLNFAGTNDKLTNPTAFAKTSGQADNSNVMGPVAVRTQKG